MKITSETVARIAREVRKVTDGKYGMVEAARPGRAAHVTDTATGLTWHGQDCARKAAAYYAGMLHVLTDPMSEPVARILRETTARHGRYCDDGRVAARAYRRAVADAAPADAEAPAPAPQQVTA